MDMAREWFAKEELGQGITRIWEPYVHDTMQANIWHVRGSEADLLVDSGNGPGDLAAALREWGLLDGPDGERSVSGGSVGGEPPAPSGRPLLLVVTHVHEDHQGGAHQFWPRIVHRAEAEWLSEPQRWHPLVAAEYTEWREALAAAGEDPSVFDFEGEYVISALPTPDFRPEEFMVTPCVPTFQVEGGEVLDLGDRRFEVLHLPGHSPGSIGLWEESSGVLFAGDVVYDPGPLFDGLSESDIPDYCATMRRVLELPIEVAYTGHGDPLDGQTVRRVATDYLERRAPDS